MSKLSDYKGVKMKRNVVNLTNFLQLFLLFSINLDSICWKNGVTLDVWSQSLFKNKLTPAVQSQSF